jgi:hypothetical protein
MKISSWIGLLGVIAACGCGGPTPVRPGTRGTISTGGRGLAEVRVEVYRRDGDEAEFVGYGVSNPEGRFGLFQDDAAGPLWLEPGEYALTLQSVSPDPFTWPVEYLDPLKTPLLQEWEGSGELVLEVPEPTPMPATPQVGQRHGRR